MNGRACFRETGGWWECRLNKSRGVAWWLKRSGSRAGGLGAAVHEQFDPRGRKRFERRVGSRFCTGRRFLSTASHGTGLSTR